MLFTNERKYIILHKASTFNNEIAAWRHKSAKKFASKRSKPMGKRYYTFHLEKRAGRAPVMFTKVIITRSTVHSLSIVYIAKGWTANKAPLQSVLWSMWYDEREFQIECLSNCPWESSSALVTVIKIQLVNYVEQQSLLKAQGRCVCFTVTWDLETKDANGGYNLSGLNRIILLFKTNLLLFRWALRVLIFYDRRGKINESWIKTHKNKCYRDKIWQRGECADIWALRFKPLTFF